MAGGYGDQGSYGGGYGGAPRSPQPAPYQQDPRRTPGGRPAQSSRGPTLNMRPVKSPGGNEYAFANIVALSQMDADQLRGGRDSNPTFYVLINDDFVLTAKVTPQSQPGEIGMTDGQRTWIGISLGPQEQVRVRAYDAYGPGAMYLKNITLDVGFASRKSTDASYDQEELASFFLRNFDSQVLAPGQSLLMDVKSIPLRLTVRTVDLMDLTNEKAQEELDQTSSDPRARGFLFNQTTIDFFKDASSNIKLKASATRPATNTIIAPNFKFEAMGIGGLDTEFSQIFRRAFASRIFPPGLVEKLGGQHVRGLLLYGPPGTGKTLIARKIGEMLNARKPKVINGPEVLSKYVGQSEENVRKLFSDAEKEYKEKGEESGLHIIIFDELDAVCKQRGSGAGGGTGVGDSVVNQLLSKLDGVDQLNNILLIGMTNRMDMIDEALLRPGRLVSKCNGLPKTSP
jgi:vesicle-fusing ATPase